MYRTLIDIVLLILFIQIGQIGFLGYLFFCEIFDAVMRYRCAGEITPQGVKRKASSSGILFKEITEIKGGYERSLFLSDTIIVDVSSPEYLIEICFDDKDITKLAKTGLNNWSVSTMWDMDTPLLTITQGSSSETISISYNEIGRYALSPYLLSLLGFPVFALAIFGLFLGLYGALVFLGMIALFAAVCFVPAFYHKVLVRLDGKGVLIKDDISERFLPFSEVATVDKGFFRIRVTTKNGEVFCFPKACYLLAELIKEFTKD
ncbi:MAG: hypothetical protein P4N41_25735 [Negativicutes bacterium]|nr:hypothetical protein [Negativicutes bacterium]MDR3593077.1 hypothetical protein [Negativicutes bacterium]